MTNGPDVNTVMITLNDMGDNEMATCDQPLALYEDDMSYKIADVLAKVSHYDAGLPGSAEEETAPPKKAAGKLGTLLGVYLPCIQNIFGVILFIRLTWVVGMAGSLESFWIVFICCCTTLLTAISMSAIATNGVVPAGGSYFMISRSLGPEFGGAVGVLFYLGTSVASSMYIIGAVEILVTYMAPQMSIFGDIDVQANAFNNFRVYGTCLLVLLIICVIVGVSFVSKFAPVSLFCVLLSILSIYIGIFARNSGNSPQVCKLGTRLISSAAISIDGNMSCTKNESSLLYAKYCNVSKSYCDPYFMENEAYLTAAIPGIASGIFTDNGFNKYTDEGNIPATDVEANRDHGEIVADITTSFTILLAIFFPSVTGIMAGSNRSGDLADAQKSIPTGTIAAILTTSFVYMSCVLFFGATIDGDVMRDKFGRSIGGGLVVANLAWPNEWVILVGSLLSTIGAGLQSLTGAPRLLQAIGKDGVIPFLRIFSKTSKHGEPLRAILLTAIISEIGILIASLDMVAPIITMFFLMCYGFVNMACALQTLLKTPNWRPRFKFYHWTLSLLGLALCIALMFISSWIYAIVAVAIAVFIYKYIEYKGAEQEWGDGITGLAMSAARFALLKLEEGPVHTKNWRPQLLILLKLDDETLQPIHRRILAFGKQLKAGRGLTVVASVLPGDYESRFDDMTTAQANLTELIDENDLKGFAQVTVANDVAEGLSQVIQSAGLGGLKPNTVVIGWPSRWTGEEERKTLFKNFIMTLKIVRYTDKCLFVLKDVDKFPDNQAKLNGTIDVWWIVHEGGLLMLLPFLLRQHRVWRNCKLRIFTVAQLEDNSIKLKKDLQKYIYQLRIEAEVHVVEMENSAISAYTYERTLLMEQRNSLLKNFQNQNVSIKEPQTIVDKCHTPAHKRFKLTSVPEETLKAEPISEMNQYTFTPQQLLNIAASNRARPQEGNVRRMHTAIRLNEVIRERSCDAQVVVLNMPSVPKYPEAEQNYIEYLDVLTDKVDRVIMVRGSGREVITIYS